MIEQKDAKDAKKKGRARGKSGKKMNSGFLRVLCTASVGNSLGLRRFSGITGVARFRDSVAFPDYEEF